MKRGTATGVALRPLSPVAAACRFIGDAPCDRPRIGPTVGCDVGSKAGTNARLGGCTPDADAAGAIQIVRDLCLPTAVEGVGVTVVCRDLVRVVGDHLDIGNA